MGLDLSIYKVNRATKNTKTLETIIACNDKMFQRGYKLNNKKLMIMGLFNEISIKSFGMKRFEKDLDKILNIVKARKININNIKDSEVLYTRNWWEFFQFCCTKYDEKKEGCSLNLYGNFIINENIVDEIRNKEFENKEEKSKLLKVIDSTDFSKETLYVKCWG